MKMIHTSYGYMTPMEASIIGRIDKQTKKRDKHMKSIGVAVGTVRSKDKLDVPVVNGKEYCKVDSDRYVLKKYVVFKGGMTHEDNHTS